MNARSFASLFAAVTFLLSVSPAATYADETDASAAPAITHLDTLPLGEGNGRIKGRSYASTSDDDIALPSAAYAYRASAYTKWYFHRVFAEWAHHEPNSAWPVMDPRVYRTGRRVASDDGGYFTLRDLPDGNYYVVAFGTWGYNVGWSSVSYLVALETEDPVAVTGGKVVKVDRSDQREIDLPCPTTRGSQCKEVEFSQFEIVGGG